MRKKVIAVATAVVLGLSGCGGGSKNDDEPSSPATPQLTKVQRITVSYSQIIIKGCDGSTLVYVYGDGIAVFPSAEYCTGEKQYKDLDDPSDPGPTVNPS